jgi:hypothetical protein
MLVRAARGVPAWSRALVPVLFVTTSLAAGAGLLLVVRVIDAGTLDRRLLMAAAACLTADTLAWMRYLRGGESRALTAVLRSPIVRGIDTALLRLVPAACLAALAATPSAPLSNGSPAATLAAACGALALVGGLWRHAELIEIAGGLSPMTLECCDSRG